MVVEVVEVVVVARVVVVVAKLVLGKPVIKMLTINPSAIKEATSRTIKSIVLIPFIGTSLYVFTGTIFIKISVQLEIWLKKK